MLLCVHARFSKQLSLNYLSDVTKKEYDTSWLTAEFLLLIGWMLRRVSDCYSVAPDSREKTAQQHLAFTLVQCQEAKSHHPVFVYNTASLYSFAFLEPDLHQVYFIKSNMTMNCQDNGNCLKQQKLSKKCLIWSITSGVREDIYPSYAVLFSMRFTLSEYNRNRFVYFPSCVENHDIIFFFKWPPSDGSCYSSSTLSNTTP